MTKIKPRLINILPHFFLKEKFTINLQLMVYFMIPFDANWVMTFGDYKCLNSLNYYGFHRNHMCLPDNAITSKFRELWSPAGQQFWPWGRLKVKVTAWRHLKGLVTWIMHAKYQCSIFNTSEDVSQVKVFVTDRQRDGRTDRQTDKWVLMSPTFAKGGGQKVFNRL